MRIIALFVTLFTVCFAASGCGVDYGAIVADAHDIVGKAQGVISTSCDPTAPTGVCVKLQQASVVGTKLLADADKALDDGKDLAARANDAWAAAQDLWISVKTLLGSKDAPPAARAAPPTAAPCEVLFNPYTEVPK